MDYVTLNQGVGACGAIYIIIIVSSCIGPHRHTIQSGVWSSRNLSFFKGRGYTIRDAIDYWYWNMSDTDEGVGFRDMCSGPHCNNNCPEMFILEREGTDVWSSGAKITIAVIVVAIAIICLLMKVC